MAKNFWNIFEAALESDQEQLPVGASPAELAIAESHFGFAFDDTLRAFYESWDGSGKYYVQYLDRCCYFMSIDWMLHVADHKETVRKKLIVDGTPLVHNTKGPVSGSYWNPKWVPIGTNTDGDYILLDFDPPTGGNVGQVFYWDHECQSTWASTSIADWLQFIGTGIRNGEFSVHYDQYA